MLIGLAGCLAMLVVLTGCKETEEGVIILAPVGEVWNEKSERLFIKRFNQDLKPHATVFDYSRDTLPASAKTALFNLVLIEGRICDHSSNRNTYAIVVTSGEGLDKTFHSDNKDCGELVDGYIAVKDVAEVITLITAE